MCSPNQLVALSDNEDPFKPQSRESTAVLLAKMEQGGTSTFIQRTAENFDLILEKQ